MPVTATVQVGLLPGDGRHRYADRAGREADDQPDPDTVSPEHDREADRAGARRIHLIGRLIDLVPAPPYRSSSSDLS